jgi:hypothetical protein
MTISEFRSGIGAQPDILTRSQLHAAQSWDFILHFVFLYRQLGRHEAGPHLRTWDNGEGRRHEQQARRQEL